MHNGYPMGSENQSMVQFTGRVSKEKGVMSIMRVPTRGGDGRTCFIQLDYLQVNGSLCAEGAMPRTGSSMTDSVPYSLYEVGLKASLCLEHFDETR